MVSFTCDNCQDTIKKPKLDAHLQRCRGPVSCLDCHQTFTGQSYKTHTSCISEAEKVQKSVFKPKSDQKKVHQVEDKPAVAEKVKDKTKKRKRGLPDSARLTEALLSCSQKAPVNWIEFQKSLVKSLVHDDTDEDGLARLTMHVFQTLTVRQRKGKVILEVAAE